MKFAVIGGDARSAWLAALLAGDGHAVRTFALEKAALPQRIAQCSSPEACAYGADWVLLGVPAEKDGVISAPLSVQRLTPGELLTALWPGQTLCGGRFAQETSLGAIRAGLSVGELMTLENPYNCPHGRPTIISMSRNELEKKFGRIV